MCKRGQMRVRFGSTRVAAHLNRRQRFEVVFEKQPITAVAATLFLSAYGVPHIQDYCRYLRALFVISINRKIASRLQSYASVFAKRAWLSVMKVAAGSSRG